MKTGDSWLAVGVAGYLLALIGLYFAGGLAAVLIACGITAMYMAAVGLIVER